MTEVRKSSGVLAGLLSIAFANTSFAVRGQAREGLDSPERLTEWLRGHLEPPSVVSAPDQASASREGKTNSLAGDVSELANFRALRDAIRTLIREGLDGLPADTEALAVLNRSAALAPSWPELVSTGE